MSTGICGVIANDSARYSLFWSCMDHLQMPDGWKKMHLIGGDWCGARNSLVEATLEAGVDYLWFMDDDHAFNPDLLMKLLRHDLPLVVPVCLTRSAPFEPVTFTERIDENNYLRIPLEDQESDGLVELVAGGCAGMLIHRDVLEAVEPPWFEYGFASEDILFCNKAIDAGFALYCDLSTKLGHITTAVVWPTVQDSEWAVGLTVGSVGATTNVILPIEHKEASAPSEKVLA